MTTNEKPIRILKQLYIEPISACNLHCKMCYGNVLNGRQRRIIEANQILDFARQFIAITSPPVTIYWCGTGEVFLHRDFPKMVNRLLAEYGQDTLTQVIQTNGTVKRLREFDSLQRLDFNVSIDGLRPFHEWHRGANTYNRTLDFCRAAMAGGCKSLWVRALLTRHNIEYLDEFHAELTARIGARVKLCLSAPFSNATLREIRTRAISIKQEDIEDAIALAPEEANLILAQKYQNRYQLEEYPDVYNYLSWNPYGIFSCCHDIIYLGDATTDLVTLTERLVASKEKCHSCSMFPCVS